jgi:adenosylmethionine-8-amino-7-oxononanoate aminotransferase
MHSCYLLDFPHIPPPYCYRCPWGLSYPDCDIQCAHELRRVIRQEGPENVAAFIAEPVIGTSMSAVVPPPEYYPIIRDICDEYDILLIVDEVMSGIGRTGKKWGIDHWQVAPDMITTAKGISSGYSPLSALILSEKVWRAIADGSKTVMHSSTYGGNPLSCATGVAVMNYIEEHDLVSRAGEMGNKLMGKLEEGLADLPCVGQVRGKGLFIGVEIVADKETKEPFPVDWNVTHRIEEEAFENGLLILGGVTGLVEGVAGDHFELLPPYVVEDEHLEFMVSTLRKSISKVVSELPTN